MIHIQPVEVRDNRVVLEVPHGRDLTIVIPPEHAQGLQAAFVGKGRGPSLFELWSMSAADGSQITEVIVEPAGERLRFHLVFVNEGCIWRTHVSAVDALMTGFHFALPFFMTEPSVPERLPSQVHDSPHRPGLLSPGVQWRMGDASAG